MKRLFIITLCIVFIITGCSAQNTSQPLESSSIVEKSPEEIVQDQAEAAEETPQAPEQGIEQAPAQEEKKIADAESSEVESSRKVDLTKVTSKRKTSYDHFNTICFAVVYDDFTEPSAPERFDRTWQEIQNMLADLEKSASVNLYKSDIYNFNQAKYGESVAISNLTAEIIAQAIEMYEFTDGAYNPAVANLVDLWGFSPRFLNKENKTMPYDRPRNSDGSYGLPDQRYVDAFKILSDFSGIKLTKSGSSYKLAKNVKDIEIDGVMYSMKIDLGGIAKGYAADKAAEILKKNGYEYGYVNIGLSSVRLLKRDVSPKGSPEEHMWAISISDPDNPSENYMTGFGKDTGVSTSGTYEVYYTIDGRKYSHIIDPHTGEPTQSNIVSVSIWGCDAGYADAITTALCVMGKEKAVKFMDTKLKDYKIAFISKDANGLEMHTNMDGTEYILE